MTMGYGSKLFNIRFADACKLGDCFAISVAMSQLSDHSGALRCAAVSALGRLSFLGDGDVTILAA